MILEYAQPLPQKPPRWREILKQTIGIISTILGLTSLTTWLIATLLKDQNPFLREIWIISAASGFVGWFLEKLVGYFNAIDAKKRDEAFKKELKAAKDRAEEIEKTHEAEIERLKSQTDQITQTTANIVRRLPRHLSQQQKNAIVKFLSDYKDKVVIAIEDGGTAEECSKYAADFFYVFREAKWPDIEGGYGIRFQDCPDGRVVYGHKVSGVHVYVNTECANDTSKFPALAKPLCKLLADLGITDQPEPEFDSFARKGMTTLRISPLPNQ